MRRFPALIAVIALTLSAPALTKPPETWDGLVLVKSKKLKNVYLLPDADFRAYTKVMLDTPEVAFRKNWRRDSNSNSRGMGSNISEADARKILDEAQTRFGRIFEEAFRKGGFEIVTAPGPDVLRVQTALINLDIAAPDKMSASHTRTFTREAGQATVVVRAKDSVSGQTLGQAIDADWAGDNGAYMRNRTTNIADFEALFDDWARHTVAGIAKLKASSPIDANGALRR
jgi:hypothetical protein